MLIIHIFRAAVFHVILIVAEAFAAQSVSGNRTDLRLQEKGKKNMNRKSIPMIFAAAMFAAAPRAEGQVYAGSIQYPLTAPSGAPDISFSGTGDAVSAGQIVGTGSPTDGSFFHALLWTAAGFVDLNPTNLSGINKSFTSGTNGTQQVGDGIFDNGINHALIWTGTAASAVDLNPTNLTGYNDSGANAINGTQQVGFGAGSATGGNHHAMLWAGTAASAVDLNPTDLGGITVSAANGTDGALQVGNANGSGTGGNNHAMLWAGIAASAVDLNPTNLAISVSNAFGVNGAEQVGTGQGSGTGGAFHALLWTGTAASAVDLNPTDLSGITVSSAIGTNGTQQVGIGSGSGTGGNEHAMLWTGTAGSAIDLQTLLPPAGTWLNSYASFIDSCGNVYGIAGGTFNDVSGDFAVEWSPVPEPAASSMLLIGGAGILMHRRRKQLA